MRYIGTVALCLLLAACGGGDAASGPAAGSPSPAPTPSQSPAGNPTSAPTPTPTPTPEPTANTQSLNVVYIGGSITEGSFATAPDKSYAGLLTAWLATRYPRVEARNLGVGGTGSDFADYRLDHDLGDFVPDLAFIEFTVNDAGQSREHIFVQLDAIIDKLRRKNPRVKIVYLSTTDAGEEAVRRAGGRGSFIEAPADAMAFEGIDFLDLGVGLWKKVVAGDPVTKYLVDSVHPNDTGHELYFEEIRSLLDPIIPLDVQPYVAGGKLIAQSRLDTAHLVPVSAAVGCHAATSPIRYMSAAMECGVGDSFTFRFTGTSVGLVRAMVRDGGRLACTVDADTPRTVDFFDVAALGYDRPSGEIDYRDLAPGDHVLNCSVSNDLVTVKGGASTGHRVLIGYFMVSDERPVTLP